MERFYLKVGDTGRPIIIECRGSNGVVQDLTGASAVIFRMTPVNSNTAKVQAAATIEGAPTNGQARYDWLPADVDTAGEFDAEVVVTIAGKESTFPTGPKPDRFVRVTIDERA